jgi:hypothetical protein
MTLTESKIRLFAPMSKSGVNMFQYFSGVNFFIALFPSDPACFLKAAPFAISEMLKNPSIMKKSRALKAKSTPGTFRSIQVKNQDSGTGGRGRMDCRDRANCVKDLTSGAMTYPFRHA